jgi:hypothetical protein
VGGENAHGRAAHVRHEYRKTVPGTAPASNGVASAEFIALANQITGRDLTAFFDAWLFATAKPAYPTSPTASALASPKASAPARAARPDGAPAPASVLSPPDRLAGHVRG